MLRAWRTANANDAAPAAAATLVAVLRERVLLLQALLPLLRFGRESSVGCDASATSGTHPELHPEVCRAVGTLDEPAASGTR